ncbi:hypothetical protein NS226_21045, partial [Aureimonas ureilytica]
PASAATGAVTPTAALAAPVAGNVTVNVAANSGAIPVTLALSGGAAASVAVATPASHGTATASGTSITYTPNTGYSGADSFTYTATNASGTSAPATVSVTVNAAPAAPVAGNVTATVTANSGANPVTLALSGGAAASVAIATPASHGTATASGTNITYTPNTDYSGADSFTYTATNASGTSAPATVSVTVNAIDDRKPAVVFVFSPPSGPLNKAMAGEAYQQAISATGGTGTKIYSLASGTLPDGIVLNISTGELNGPLKPGTEGDYRFAIAITDGTGATGSASYTLSVRPRAVTVTDKAVLVADGQAPANVYLNAGATGGPFVSADVVDVVPSNAGTAQIIEGEVAALETVRPRGFYLKFTPNPLFAGTASVGFRLTSDLGISNTGSVSYQIALDRAAVAEKADRAVRDFVSARQSLLSNHVAAPGLLDRRLASQANERANLRIAPYGNGIGVTVGTSTAQLEAARRTGDGSAAGVSLPLFNVWFHGTLIAHKQGSSSGQTIDPLGLKIDMGTGADNGWGSFSLLSAGVDYLVSDRLLVGVAVHSDRMTDPRKGTFVQGAGILAGPYASVALLPSLTLDTSLLYGQSWNSVDLGTFNGSFDTTRLMATTKLEGLMGYGAWTLRPNLKLNYLTEQVEDYDVSGSSTVVAMTGFTEDDLRFSTGLTVGYLMPLPNGWTLSPELGGSIGLSSANDSRNVGDGVFGTIEAGFTLAGEDGWTLQAAGMVDLEREETRAVGGRVSLSLPF